jgi:hypothetical protein
VKKKLLFIWLFVGIFVFPQQNSESKNWDVNAFYKPGETLLKKEFNRALSYAVDQNFVVYGTLTFSIFVDSNGKAKIVDVIPKVKNYKLLLDDLNYVLRKSNKNWEAARKDSKPVQSLFYYQIRFNTEVYDED